MALHRIVRNVATSYLLYAANAAIGFLLVPLMLHRLGSEKYGVYVLVVSVSSLLETCDLGLGVATVRFVSERKHRSGATRAVQELVSTAGVFAALVGALIFVAVLATRGAITEFFHLSGSAAQIVSAGLVVCVAAVPLQMASSILLAYLQAEQEFYRGHTVDLVTGVCRSSALALLVVSGAPLPSLFFVYPVAAVFRLLGMAAAVMLCRSAVLPSLFRVRLSALRDVHRFSLVAFSEDRLKEFFFYHGPTLLAARLLTLDDVAVVGALRRVASLLVEIASRPLAVAYPLLTDADAASNFPARGRFLVVTLRNWLLFSGVSGMALLIWSRGFLQVWLGPGWVASAGLLRYFVVFAILTAVADIPVTLLYGIGRLRAVLILTAVKTFVGLGVAVPAAARYGLAGMLITFLAVQVVATVALVILGMREADVSLARLSKNALSPVLLPVVTATASLAAAAAWFDPGWVSIASSCAISAVAAALVVWQQQIRRREGSLADALKRFVLEEKFASAQPGG